MQAWKMEQKPMTPRDMPTLVKSLEDQKKVLEDFVEVAEEFIEDWEGEILSIEIALKQLKSSVANPAPKVDQRATSNLA